MGKNFDCGQKSSFGKRQFGLFFTAFAVTFIGQISAQNITQEVVVVSKHSGVGVNCTPLAIKEFPDDLFTEEQRERGAIVLHFFISLYVFYAISIVCNDHLVPSCQKFSDEFRIPKDIAGATFLAIGSSAPELFTNVVGTFVTKGDIGLGAIVGSAVFNVLAVTGMLTLIPGKALQLDWYPVSRDCLFYALSVFLLIIILYDGQIIWYESLALVLFYFIYIYVMYNNSAFRDRSDRLMNWFSSSSKSECEEKRYLLSKGNDNRQSIIKNELLKYNSPIVDPESCHEFIPADPGKLRKNDELKLNANGSDVSFDDSFESVENQLIWPNDKNFCEFLLWFLSWPIYLILKLTVPDCRLSKYCNWYPMTLIMCTLWIGFLSYITSWMITIIGYTLAIPDSILGLTALAAGTSLPEAISSIIVCKIGLGTMGISNTIGSNSFDILVCLGLPWLVRDIWLVCNETGSFVFNLFHSEGIHINSAGLEYSTGMLLISLAFFYLILCLNKFRLNKFVGLSCIALYLVFLVFASLFELNAFFEVNLPPCAL